MPGCPEQRDERGVPVARDDLGRERLAVQAELGHDLGFDRGIEVRVRPDRAGELAEADLLARRGQPRPVARHLEVPADELQPQRVGLGVDAVRAADHHRVLVLDRAPLQDGQQAVESRRGGDRRPATRRSACAVSTTSEEVRP